MSSGGEEGDWRGRRGDITDTREGGDTIRYTVTTTFICNHQHLMLAMNSRKPFRLYK